MKPELSQRQIELWKEEDSVDLLERLSIALFITNETGYHQTSPANLTMIKSFQNKETAKIYQGRFSKRFAKELQKKALVRLM